MNSIYLKTNQPFWPREQAFSHLPEWCEGEKIPHVEVRIVDVKADSAMASGWAVRAANIDFTSEYIDSGWFTRTDGRRFPLAPKPKDTTIGKALAQLAVMGRKSDVKR